VTRLLHVSASPSGAHGRSGRVAAAFVDAFRLRYPQAEVDVLDLFSTPLPPVGTVAAAAPAGHIVRRFTMADYYIFSVPMWNFGIPYPLKHFIDVVTQSGVTFRLSARDGYRGLLTGRRACVVYTSGVYRPGCPPAFGADFQSSYLNHWLDFLGVRPVIEVALRPTDFTDRLADDLDRARTDAQKAAYAI
jgi:FMN-dependent NADH-azoreductase